MLIRLASYNHRRRRHRLVRQQVLLFNDELLRPRHPENFLLHTVSSIYMKRKLEISRRSTALSCVSALRPLNRGGGDPYRVRMTVRVAGGGSRLGKIC